jgi:uncharacterized protein (TIGR02145 family)
MALVALAVTSATIASPSIALSGRALNPDSTGKSGVSIAIAGTAWKTTTTSAGNWSLPEATTAIPHANLPNSARPLKEWRPEAGHICLPLGDHDILGHRITNLESPVRTKSAIVSPRRASDRITPDTLVYSFNGSVFLRDTLSVLSQSGIVRIYDTTWNADIVYGYLTDTRDGQMYRTVQIGSQTWMAQNLNYAGSGKTVGECCENSADSCTKYGRRYSWQQAIPSRISSNANPSGVQGVCPTGWHVPSDTEWTILQKFVDSTNTTDGYRLKSAYGWVRHGDTLGNGTDSYGFRALPGGKGGADAGYVGYWWSATQFSPNASYLRYLYYTDSNMYSWQIGQTFPLSLRCSRD